MIAGVPKDEIDAEILALDPSALLPLHVFMSTTDATLGVQPSSALCLVFSLWSDGTGRGATGAAAAELRPAG
jgi:hypothetical protein